jgi:hypothetical protein
MGRAIPVARITGSTACSSRSRRTVPGSRSHARPLLTSLADALSFHDIEFESDDFNREFNVSCEVPKFANDLIDQRMMAWLLATGSGFRYEALGNRVLVAGPRIEPAELPLLLGAARGFVQHVPEVVSSLYPG